MNIQKVINQLKSQYPNKNIVKNPQDNPTEIICEIDPALEHADHSTAIAVIDKITPHYHKETKEVYEVIKGNLTVVKNGKEIALRKGDKLTIEPSEIHSAYGNEVWIKAYSKPGWTKEDHILVENTHAYYNNLFFARFAKLYDYEKYILSSLRKKAAKFFNLPHSTKIIDVATGTGAQAYELAKLGHNVIGVDLSPEMLKQAEKKISRDLSLVFKQADATNLPFKSNSFDAASVSWGLHDMPRDIGIKVLKEIKRVTRSSGSILIVDYMEPKNHWVAKLTHPLIKLYETKNYEPFIEKGLNNILSKVNLRITRKTNFLGFVQIVVISNSKK